MDELIREYVDKLALVYNRRTAGDYTFDGILSEFARKITELDVHNKIKETIKD